MLAVRDGGAPRKGVPPRCRGLGAAQPSPAPRPPRGPSARRRGRNSSHFLCAERYRCCPKPPGIFRPPCPRPLLMEQTGRLFRALFSCTFILSNKQLPARDKYLLVEAGAVSMLTYLSESRPACADGTWTDTLGSQPTQSQEGSLFRCGARGNIRSLLRSQHQQGHALI
ncbi:hypothetical protein R6Z07F_004277 [Ovis aries]